MVTGPGRAMSSVQVSAALRGLMWTLSSVST